MLPHASHVNIRVLFMILGQNGLQDYRLTFAIKRYNTTVYVVSITHPVHNKKSGSPSMLFMAYTEELISFHGESHLNSSKNVFLERK